VKLIGRYKVQERVGEGAIADVYKAHDPSIDRVLAIKVLKSEYRQNEQLAARFVREAKAAGALSHPNIVTIYDVGDVGGYPYIAMELLDGQPLDLAMRADPLPVDAVIAIGLQLARALSYAHGLGVVHRDIKPSNIMLAGDRRSIKLLDFGIARVVDAGAVQDEKESLKTQIGQVLGTPRYMSPEQAIGEDVDGRSDLFSVGLVLYELVTGKKAFVGTNATTLALQIALATPQPIDQLAPNCPRGLQYIIEKLLEKKPERRFVNGAQLADALLREQRVSAAVAAEARTLKRRFSRHALLTLAMASIMSLVLLTGMNAVTGRQYAAMERMVLTSGASISSFVANNAALRAVDNAALPPAERDWLPVQAFVKAAAQDANVVDMKVVDSEGVVQAATDRGLVGRRYRPAIGESLVANRDGIVVTTDPGGEGRPGVFRFVRPMIYAGRSFGTVELSLSKAELESIGNSSLYLLLALGVLTFGAVVGASYAASRLLVRPIGRLKEALHEAARGNFDFRISHMRKDEFGELFDGFNLLANAVQDRFDGAERAAMSDDLSQTRVTCHGVAGNARDGGAPHPQAGAETAPRRSA
jgi:serine/threonine-protein kinase